MRLPKAQQLTKDQHQHLRNQIQDAWRNAKYPKSPKMPPEVSAANRIISRWNARVTRANSTRSGKLSKAQREALNKLLFSSADEARAAVAAFVELAESL